MTDLDAKTSPTQEARAVETAQEPRPHQSAVEDIRVSLLLASSAAHRARNGGNGPEPKRVVSIEGWRRK